MSELVIRNFLSNVMEYPRHVVDGIMARLDVESPGYNPAAWYRGGGGYGARGIAQWRGPRFEGLNARAQANGTDWRDLGTQLEHFRAEMQGPYAAVDRNLRASTNAQEALEIFTDGYEVPGPDPVGRARARNNLARIERSQPLANPPEPPRTKADAILEISRESMPPEAQPSAADMAAPDTVSPVAPQSAVRTSPEAAPVVRGVETAPRVSGAAERVSPVYSEVQPAPIGSAPRVSPAVAAARGPDVPAQPAAVSPTRTAPATPTPVAPQTVQGQQAFSGMSRPSAVPQNSPTSGGGVGGKPSSMQDFVRGGPGGQWGNPNLPEGMEGALVPVSQRPGLRLPGLRPSLSQTPQAAATSPPNARNSAPGQASNSAPAQEPNNTPSMVDDGLVGDPAPPRDTSAIYGTPAEPTPLNPLNPPTNVQPATGNQSYVDSQIVDAAVTQARTGGARPVPTNRIVAPSATSQEPMPVSTPADAATPDAVPAGGLQPAAPPPSLPPSAPAPVQTQPISGGSGANTLGGGAGIDQLAGALPTPMTPAAPVALPPINPTSNAIAASGPSAMIGQQVGGAVSNAAAVSGGGGVGGKGGGVAMPAVGGK